MRVRRLDPLALAVCVSALVASGACKKAAAGQSGDPGSTRPIACPYRPNWGSGPKSDPMRCSYQDAVGQGATEFRGSVVGEEEEGLGTPLAGMWVGLFGVDDASRPDERGTPRAKGTTDATGSFHLSALVDAGEYFLVTRAEPNGETLGILRITIEKQAKRQHLGIRIVVPLDPELRRDDGEFADAPEESPEDVEPADDAAEHAPDEVDAENGASSNAKLPRTAPLPPLPRPRAE